MKPHLITALTLTASLAMAASSDPSLPSWDETEHKQLEDSGWTPGTSLPTVAPTPDPAAEPEPAPLDADQPTPEEVAESAAPVAKIAEKFLPAYFDARPESYLIDPQHILDHQSARDRLAFLESHAGDSTIDLFIYIFGKDQEIPGEVREEELVERFFSSGRPAMIIYYFFGQPQQSVLYLSPSLTDAVSAAEQRRALTSSVMLALEKTDPTDQLEAFTVQLAIRIYWMERMLQAAAPTGNNLQPAAPNQPPKTTHQKLTLAQRVDGMTLLLHPYLRSTAWGGGIAALALAFGWWWRRRTTFRLPEFEVEPPLGGHHEPGMGAVISFASPTLPPASQREQVPDYLRRPGSR
ncbi:MAG: hypothetical protein K9N23_20605 [Akkermansiaceae bacterium]|nr:hypothetical protein [Akkermansiaceae bacterium]